jgi:hypothetical protein
MKRYALILCTLLSCNDRTPTTEAPTTAAPSASASVAASAVPSAPKPPPPLSDAEILRATCESMGKIDCEPISGFTTTYQYEGKKYRNRAHNIQLVADKLNNTILAPGARLHFNTIVGERNEENGFKKAPIYFAGLKMQGMGGGTCQVSSTLYAAAMFAHLKVVQRTAHTRPSSYIKPGMDATVDYGVLDLIIENSYDFPIYLEASADAWAKKEEDDPEAPKKKVLGIWFNALKGKTPKFEVKHSWYGYETIPFEVRHISSIYHRGPPKREQRGKEGMPGRRLWVYLDEDGKEFDRIRVVSRYKPVDEVWIENPSYEPPEETTDAGLTEQP